MIIDFGQNLGQRSPLINSGDKKNDDCGISAASSEIPACVAYDVTGPDGGGNCLADRNGSRIA
jgi:hypothetical protein